MPNGLRGTRARVISGAGHRTLGDVIKSLRPVGYWPLDETGGTTANDRSGFGRNGTYTGTGYTLANRAGADGVNYVSLGDGGNAGYIVISDNDAFTIATNSGLTVFCLAKPDSVAGTTNQSMMAKGNTGQFEWQLCANNAVAGRLGMFCWNTGGSTIRSATFDTVMSTAWQACLAIVPAPVTLSSLIHLFRNTTGLLPIYGGGANTPVNGTSTVMLGHRSDLPANQHWDGGLAHCAIFPYAMNADSFVPLLRAARLVTG